MARFCAQQLDIEHLFDVGPGAFQPPPQILIVVNLADEDDPYTAVFVRHRLPARRQVDNRQAAMAERDPRHRFIRGSMLQLCVIGPFAVRPTMPQALSHPRQHRRLNRLVGLGPDGAGDTAHGKGSEAGNREIG